MSLPLKLGPWDKEEKKGALPYSVSHLIRQKREPNYLREQLFSG